MHEVEVTLKEQREVAEKIPKQAGRASRASSRVSGNRCRHSFLLRQDSRNLLETTSFATTNHNLTPESLNQSTQHVRQKHVVATAEHEGAPSACL